MFLRPLSKTLLVGIWTAVITIHHNSLRLACSWVQSQRIKMLPQVNLDLQKSVRTSRRHYLLSQLMPAEIQAQGLAVILFVTHLIDLGGEA